jgi:hypothetical protein
VANYFDASVAVLLGDGSGGFSGPTNFPTGYAPTSLATGDLDGDGANDLAVAKIEGTVSVLLGDGTGGLGGPADFATDRVSLSVVTGDFDRNGNLDLAVANNNGDLPNPNANVTILLNRSCTGDLDHDCAVGVVDFLSLLMAWGPGRGHPADLDHDGMVGPQDLQHLLANWGPCA